MSKRAGNVNYPIKSKILKWVIPSKSAEAKLTFVENYRVRNWVNSKKNTKYVFNRLELGRGVDKVLDNPKLHLYVSYIDRFNKKNPTKEVTLLDMFTKTYGDNTVARMIEIGMYSPRAKTFSTRMREELLDSWLSKGKTAEDIFSLLKIDTAGYNLFRSPKMNKDSNPTLNLFATYTDQLNMQNRRHKVKMIDLFSQKYDDKGIAKMVEMGFMVPSTNKVASMLWRELLTKWKNNGESVDDVFKLLKLDKAGDSFRVSGALYFVLLREKEECAG